jgi:nitrile hydratase subunit beta
VNGIHDMGGMHGFGRVEREPNEPVFHEAWERRVFGLTGQCLRNIDEFRHAIERMAPVDYLGSSYYERWLDGTLRLLIEKGVITREALERRMAELASGPDPAPPHSDPELLARIVRRLKARTRFRQPGPPPRYALGDHVVTRHDAPVGHTRLPRYARGKLSGHQRTWTGRAAPPALQRPLRGRRAVGCLRRAVRVRPPRPLGALPRTNRSPKEHVRRGAHGEEH